MVTCLKNSLKIVWNQKFGESFSSVLHSSIQLFKKEESSDHLDGISVMNSTTLIWKRQTPCLNCSWIPKMKYHGMLFFSSLVISTMVEELLTTMIEDAWLLLYPNSASQTYWKKATSSHHRVFIINLEMAISKCTGTSSKICLSTITLRSLDWMIMPILNTRHKSLSEQLKQYWASSQERQEELVAWHQMKSSWRKPKIFWRDFHQLSRKKKEIRTCSLQTPKVSSHRFPQFFYKKWRNSTGYW